MGLKAILMVFYAWTLSQFLTYYFTASYVRQIQALFVSSKVHYVPYFQISLALTFLQLINKFIDYHSKNKSPEPLGFLVLETLENLIVNYSFTFLHGSSVYVIKMSQPVTNSLVNRILFKKSGTIEELFGTPFIVLGALSYTLDEPKIRVKRIGIALAIISTFLAAVLAVFRKIFHGGDNIKSSVTVMTMTVWFLWQVSAAITVWMVEMWRVIPRGSSSIVGALFSFGFFHFANQHLSNFMVVKVMGSVNRMCAGLIRKLLVVLLLIGTDAHRHSMIALLALVLALLGMLIRTLGRIDRLDSAFQDGNLDNSGAWMLPPKTYRIAQYFLVLTTLALGIVMVNQYRDLIKQERQRLEAVRKAIKSHEHDYEARMALFMTLKLTDHPDLTDARARTLTDSHAVVGEANRVLIHILADILVSIQETVVLSLSDDNSVANMAEKAGAVFLLQKLNKTFYFYCLHSKCNREGRVGWQFLNNKQSKDIALIVQGGHQVFQKPENKMISQLFLETFLHSLVLFLPLNIDPGMKLFETSNITFSSYFNRSRVYLLLSDRYSLEEAKKYFKNVKTILAPSSSFGFGMVSQRIKPSYDVLILRTKGFQLQKIRKSFPNIRFHVAEMQIGLKFNINSSDVETAMLAVQAGLQFLQKGRVILTDYLYVHILCVLQSIPHVLVEKADVNSSLQFHSSWTAGLESVIRIDNDDDHVGAESAVKLVQRPNRL
ncbi:pyruvyl transferase 1 [Biomphalaria pfeifferi]|uniref:Pyruvyl transferase 1 n=1 Tax=Biomphalaria pfeifferi TaxID=112525 RepID=A0AAD8BRI8_BIOPF|nr:pyruvyl transferase 1 [Biomphalaria pfeifferi]